MAGCRGSWGRGPDAPCQVPTNHQTSLWCERIERGPAFPQILLEECPSSLHGNPSALCIGADNPSDPSLPQKPVHDCAPSRKQKLLIRLHEKMKDIEERRCIGSSVFLVQKGPRAIPLEHEVEAKLVVKVQRCGSRSSWPPRLDTALALHGGDARSANGKCRLRPARRPSIPRPNEGCSPAHRARSFSGRAASK